MRNAVNAEKYLFQVALRRICRSHILPSKALQNLNPALKRILKFIDNFLALPCLSPSFSLRIGSHRHRYQGSVATTPCRIACIDYQLELLFDVKGITQWYDHEFVISSDASSTVHKNVGLSLVFEVL